MRSFVVNLLVGLLLAFAFWGETVEAGSISQSDVVVSDPEPSDRPVSVEEYFGRKVARLFDQPATLAIDGYQQIGEIVPSVIRGEHTISLFTSGVDGALPPSAVIDGSAITMDLSSLYLSQSWGDGFRIWNIGGHARGTIDLTTLEFYVSWDRTVRDRDKDPPVTFSLQGTLVPVPLAGAAVPFVTGLAMLLGMWRQKGRSGTGRPTAAV